jgi:hypothetical protein
LWSNRASVGNFGHCRWFLAPPDISLENDGVSHAAAGCCTAQVVRGHGLAKSDELEELDVEL